MLISQDDGEAVTYSLGKLDDRGRMFVKAGDPLYEGMIIGIHSRDNDLVVNAVRGKQLTNFRVSGKDRVEHLYYFIHHVGMTMELFPGEENIDTQNLLSRL